MSIVEEECEESIYWMEILVESGLVAESGLRMKAEGVDGPAAYTIRNPKSQFTNEETMYEGVDR